MTSQLCEELVWLLFGLFLYIVLYCGEMLHLCVVNLAHVGVRF